MKNANAHVASMLIVTIAAMAPPETPDDFLFTEPARTGSAGEVYAGIE